MMKMSSITQHRSVDGSIVPKDRYGEQSTPKNETCQTPTKFRVTAAIHGRPTNIQVRCHLANPSTYWYSAPQVFRIIPFSFASSNRSLYGWVVLVAHEGVTPRIGSGGQILISW